MSAPRGVSLCGSKCPPGPYTWTSSNSAVGATGASGVSSRAIFASTAPSSRPSTVNSPAAFADNARRTAGSTTVSRPLPTGAGASRASSGASVRASIGRRPIATDSPSWKRIISGRRCEKPPELTKLRVRASARAASASVTVRSWSRAIPG
jgi:hypothetical protein